MGDEDWGQNLANYFIAIPQGALQKVGGNFFLTAEVNFGVGFGMKVLYIKTEGTNIASAGFIRMARDEVISWRNEANDDDLSLSVNASDELLFNGVKLQPAGDYITELTGDVAAIGPGSVVATIQPGVIVDSMVDAAADIARSKLAAGTAAYVVINDGSGDFSEEQRLAKVRGGSGQDNSSLTFPSTGTLATLAGTETFSNKTFSDAETFGQISTPSTPASGFTKFYAKSDDQFYQVNDSGTESQIINRTNDFVGDSGTGGTNGLVPAPAAGDQAAGKFLAAGGTWAQPSLVGSVPTGSIFMYGTGTAPTGYVNCDGAAINRITFAALFALLGTTYGAGNGTTTFNVPNFQGIFPRGIGSQVIGGITYTGVLATLQADQTQSHTHGWYGQGSLYGSGAFPGVDARTSGSIVAAITPPTVDGANGTPRSGPETRPANIGINFIIKT